jgi:hypothetical protein
MVSSGLVDLLSRFAGMTMGPLPVDQHKSSVWESIQAMGGKMGKISL